MTERIDHAAEAIKHRDYAESPGPGDPQLATNWLISAQVHATLALVEQQRIANLIAIGQFSHDAEDDTRFYIGLAGSEAAYVEAAGALGIKPEVSS